MLLNNVDVEPRLFARFQRRVFSARIREGEYVAPKRPTNAMEGLGEGRVSDRNRGLVAGPPELRFAREISAESNSAIDVGRNQRPSRSAGSSDRGRGRRVRPKASRSRSSTRAPTPSSSNGMKVRTPSPLTAASASRG